MPYSCRMRRRSWIAVCVLCGIVLLAAVCWPRPEPHYQGRPLSDWLRGFESDTLEARWQSAEAVRHIGTNALPLLITRLQHQPPLQEPQWKQKLRVWLSKQSLITINLPRPASVRRETLAALDALGPSAKAAIPAVEKLLHENPPDPQAVLVLARLGPDAVPALTRALTNDEKAIRLGARACLEMLASDSAILYPTTAEEADFARRTCQFNLAVLKGALEDYKAQHPEAFSSDGMPRPSLPPDFIPPEMARTNEPQTSVPPAPPDY